MKKKPANRAAPLLARAPLHKSPVPLVKAGLQDELTMMFDRLGVQHEGAAPTDDWVRTAHADPEAADVRLRPMPLRPGRVPNVEGLTLRDALGRSVRAATMALPATGLTYELNLTGLAPGLYLLEVQAGTDRATQRLVVE